MDELQRTAPQAVASTNVVDVLSATGSATETDAKTPAGGAASAAKESDIDRVWEIYQNAKFVQSMISPKRKSTAVISIVVVTTLVFACFKFMMLSGDDALLGLYQQLFGMWLLDPHRVLGGQYWRLFTYMLLHKDEVHLLMNMIGLFWFGRIAENIYGTPRFICIFVLAGILGGIVHCLTQPGVMVVGDSGAVMGIFAAVGVGIFRLRKYLPASVCRSELSWLIGLALSGFLIDKMVPQVAAIVHLGGMLAGLLFGSIVSVPRPSYAKASSVRSPAVDSTKLNQSQGEQ